jgi:hypothetical protein
MGWACSTQKQLGMHTVFCLEKLKVRDHLRDLSVNGKITLEWILGKYDGRMWTGCIWLRIGANGVLL